MNEEIILIIVKILREALEKYENLAKLATANGVSAPRPRTFVMRGANCSVLLWPGTDDKGNLKTSLLDITAKWGSDTIHMISLREKYVKAIVGEDPRAALRVLRQAESLLGWVNAREEGIQRSIAEKQRQQAHVEEYLDAEIALRKLGGMP